MHIKRIALLLSIFCLLVSVTGCDDDAEMQNPTTSVATTATTGATTETQEVTTTTATTEPEFRYSFAVTQEDIDYLNQLYNGRVAYFGDLHDHCSDGLPNDGKKPLSKWKSMLDTLDMDFQAFVNHRQAYHMYVPQWDNTRFIGGTEPATEITDSKAQKSVLHYNMIVPNGDALVEILKATPKFGYTGGKDGVPDNEGTFEYAKFTTEEFQTLIQLVQSKGGLFVHVHPKQYMKSEDPLDYWFADYTGLEVFYNNYQTNESKANYKLWTDLLAAGKRVWATAGHDQHTNPAATTLNVIYSEKQDASTYVSHLAEGDFVCGSVGIRMCVGDATMGGHTDFAGKRVTISIGDWHSRFLIEDHTYRVDVISDTGVIYTQYVKPTETTYIAFNADENAQFYRVEVRDMDIFEPLISIGNPIWND